jgi:predicted site-specific integrase-resolvase
MNEKDFPWVPLREVCRMYGVTYETAKNKISAGLFDVPVFKIGKTWAVDRAVHEEYFRRLREKGLRELSTRG